ncbi:MAG: ABC transporter permease [Saprospiraceae bacterium]|nr:ABC transporter permease [Saprospiraceae bacterium]
MVIVFYAFVGLFNSLIANDQALLASQNHQLVFPAFYDLAADWGLVSDPIRKRETGFDWAVYPPIHYKAGTIDKVNASFCAPGACIKGSGHWLGTDQLGRDVAAGIVRGCYTSFRIGLLATWICAILGIIIGMSMGYFGNKKLKVSPIQAVVLILGLLASIYFLIYQITAFSLHPLLFWLLWLTIWLGSLFVLARSTRKFIGLPIDGAFSRIIEWRRSVPTLILMLVLFPLFDKPAINNVILVILILGWTGFARHARAETMSIKERQYVISASIMGAGHLEILRRHILPNILHTLMILAAMNFAGNVLLESTLSFLGMGLPPEEVSWGSLLSEGRKITMPGGWWYFPAWRFLYLYTASTDLPINIWRKMPNLCLELNMV